MNKQIWLVVSLYLLLIVAAVSLFVAKPVHTLLFIIVAVCDLTALMLEITGDQTK
ncbi:hypothetical protein [Lacticaseibacillus jixiensis]|uniref:hypothetical protein n=1 Tax=Lacticaseibacillus jixiensis TaxID=3231926 RepID=UPI0036F2F5CC